MRTDHGLKPDAYFVLPSVEHYPLVGSQDRQVVHHARHGGGKLLTALVPGGPLRLDPPGTTVEVDAFHEGSDLA